MKREEILIELEDTFNRLNSFRSNLPKKKLHYDYEIIVSQIGTLINKIKQ